MALPNMSQFGNDLYTGKRSIDFIGRQKTWYVLSGVLIALALVGIFARGLNFGIEFRGGSEFRVSGVSDTSDYEQKAQDAMATAGISGNIEATVVGGNSVTVQTEDAGAKNEAAKSELAKEFGVPVTQVSASVIGPSWGESVSQQAIRALIVFLILVSLVMAVYFRTWKMALAGLVALLHDLVITIGIYALFGFEITPSSMIGFLTILGYSLYDTVVVFDKVRENTAAAFISRRQTYAQAANLAVNQTLVRSINTTIVALLPIAAILVVGFTVLGPGTLLDLSLALFVGIAVGAYSSIFIATPLLVDLRRNEQAVKDLDKAALKAQAKAGLSAKEAASWAALNTGSAAARSGGSVAVAERPVRTASASGTRGDVPDAVPSDGPEGLDELDEATSDVQDDTSTARGDAASPDAARPGGEVHKWATSGPRNQPKRTPKSKR